MPDPSRPRKSRSTRGGGGSSGDESVAPVVAPAEPQKPDAGKIEIAPEGVAPDPALLFARQGLVRTPVVSKGYASAAPPAVPAASATPTVVDTIAETSPQVLADNPVEVSIPTAVEMTTKPPVETHVEAHGVAQEPNAAITVRARRRAGHQKEAPVKVADEQAPAVPAVPALPVVPAVVPVLQAEPEAGVEPEPLEPTPDEKKGLWARLGRVRASWGWVLGLAALGIAFYGQKLAADARTANEAAPPALSWVMFAVAGALFALGIASLPAMGTEKTAPFFATLRSMRRRRLFLGLIGIALALGLASLPLFYVANKELPDAEIDPGWWANTGSWLLWIAAMLLFGLAWVVWERGGGRRTVGGGAELRITNHELPGTIDSAPSTVRRLPSTAGLPARWHWGIIIGLFVLAVALRFPNLENAPPGLWFDEAEEGLLAQGLLGPNAVHHTFLGGYYTMGTIYLYILGLIIKFLGAGIWQLRLLPAIGGSLMVPMLYVLGTRLYNWRVGLVAGTLLAVASWHITFSRLGMNSMPTFALDLGVYLCVMQGLRTGRFGYYAGAGVLMGLALQTYLASQVVPLVLVVLLSYRLITERMRFFRAIRAGIAVFAVSAVLTFIPLGTFAAQHPDTFTSRAGAVSIFSEGGGDNQADPLLQSIRRHAYMFNYRGDSNPRHNLPGEPMLDWLTAAMFLAGLAASVLRIWKWQYLFPVVWFVASISGGVLSLLFEAPQSHRTLENSVVTALLAATFLGGLWTALDERVRALWASWRKRRAEKAVGAGAVSASGRGLAVVPHVVIAGAVAAVLVWAGLLNVNKYFVRQMNDMGVWLEMSGANRAVGTLLSQFPRDYVVYISPDRTNTPTSMYLAPGKNPLVWPGGSVLPFTEERNVAVLLGPTDQADVFVIKRMYPNAKVNTILGPNNGDPQIYDIQISADDIRSVRGTQQIDEAHAAATLKISDYQSYTFGWQDKGSVPQLLVDGNEVAMGQAMNMAVGLHSVVLSGTQGMKVDFGKLLMDIGSQASNPVPSVVLFDPRKVEPLGLIAILRQGDTFDATPVKMRIDPQVSFYFHEIPLNRPYTVEWQGKVYAPVGGDYSFFTEQLSRSRLFIDGRELLYNPQDNILLSASVNLPQGLHDIRLQYEDLAGFSHMYLYWTPPGMNGHFIIPTNFLRPPMGRYPEIPTSGAWPGIDQTDDTVWGMASQGAQAVAVTEPQPTAGVKPTEVPVVQQPEPQQEQPTPALPANIAQPSAVLGSVGDATIANPKAAAVDGQGNVYIYTANDGKVHKLGARLEKIAEWDVAGEDGKPLMEASAMLVKDGKLLLLDSADAEVIRYTLDGQEEGRTHVCQCYFPRGMFPASNGNMWVTDTGFGHVFKVNAAGQTLTTLGEKGTLPGQFVEPSSVWESPQGNLFVTDAGNQRVQSFTPDGKPLAQWGMGEGTARDGNRLTGTPEGNVLVTHYDGRAIIEYKPDGTEIGRWVYQPTDAPLIPAGIAPAGGGKYVVLFPFDNTVGIFELGK